jgi:hypothetical protein
MKETEFSARDADLIRWCYVVGGLSRARLARDFECSIADIEKVVSTGLGEVLSPGHVQPSAAPILLGTLALPLAQAVGRPNEDGEWLRKIFRRALTEV